MCRCFWLLDSGGGNKQHQGLDQRRLDDEDDIVSREFAPRSQLSNAHSPPS